MEFSSTHRPIPSPLVLHRTIAVKAVAYSPLPRKSPRNDLRTSYAVHFGKIGFVSRVYGESMSNISVIWTRHRTLLPSIASKGEAELNSGIAGAGMVAAAAVTVILAVANRVLYKLALVPMRQYPFFLAQVTTFGYVAVYFAILSARCSFGIVTREMLAIPKFLFVVIGLLEALGVACGMSAGAILPGPAISILSQTFLVWQLVFSVLILGRRYSLNQTVGCFLVTAGVILAVARQRFVARGAMPMHWMLSYGVSRTEDAMHALALEGGTMTLESIDWTRNDRKASALAL